MIEDRTWADRPAHLTGRTRDFTPEDIEWVARQFKVVGPIIASPFPGRGNINLHTYHLIAGQGEYLLQQVNSQVFTMPRRVMEAMIASIEAQRRSLDRGLGDDLWQPVELVPTKTGESFLDLSDDQGLSVWRLMVMIPRSVTYKSLSEVTDREAQIRLAEEVGRGLAIYSDLTSEIAPDKVQGSLPGYRDTELYYSQFRSVMAGHRHMEEARSLLPQDPVVREGTAHHFLVAVDEAEHARRKSDPEVRAAIALVQEREPFAKCLWTALREGRIRHTLIHGDTKIDNFLFCSETGRVKSLVDLDTIMPFTWLADWGDMLRSLVNVAGEKERDLGRVTVDKDVYGAVARGFLRSSRGVTDAEVALMVNAVQVIALELGLRFLTDYLRGDTYFRLESDDSPDLNKVRAAVQLELYRKLVEFGPEAEAMIARTRSGAP